MRVATWNVNGLRARLDFLLHWLERRRPDVVGLQELKLEEEQFPYDVLEGAGYRALVHGQKAWNGVAILSRAPAELVERGLETQPEWGARLICARVEGLEFTTVYCPNGKSTGHAEFPGKLTWLDTLVEREHARKDTPSRVLCGDFNVCPEPLDSWNEARLAGHIFHTDEERGRLARLTEAGCIDLFRARYPEEPAFSWWDYRGGAFHKNQGLRIDLVLGSPDLADRVQSVEIDREYRKKKDGLTPSDHAPVMVDLAFPG